LESPVGYPPVVDQRVTRRSDHESGNVIAQYRQVFPGLFLADFVVGHLGGFVIAILDEVFPVVGV
jgi:hypothetical protein